MSQKAKIIATKLKNNIRFQLNNPQELYEVLTKKFNSQKDYFSTYYEPVELLKVVIYLYFLKRDGGFDEADKVLENIEFIKLFYVTDEASEVECDECNGTTYTDCSECGGDGRVTCSECGGDGEVECDECDGDGEIEGEDGLETCEHCSGNGTVTCPDCNGDGDVTCDVCSGEGRNECDVCNGYGQVDSEYLKNAELLFVCSWNKELNDRCELNAKTLYPVGDFDSFTDVENKIVLSTRNIEIEPEDEIETEKLYCLSITDTPVLKLNDLSKLSIKTSNAELRLYGQQ